MATKNFYLFLVGISCCLFFTSACETLKLKGRSEGPTSPPQQVETAEPVAPPPQAEAPEFLQKESPKLGLILGGGGALAYGHIGLLQELEDNKIPIHSMVGIEWGALVGGAYALEGKAHSVEWKLLKLPGDAFANKSFFSSGDSAPKVTQFKSFLNGVFAKANTGDLEIPFACPYSNLAKGVSGISRSGLLKNIVKACWVSEPHFKIDLVASNSSAVLAAADRLRSQGAELIVYIDVLSRNNPLSSKDRYKHRGSTIQWLNLKSSLSDLKGRGVDEVIALPLGDYRINSYKSLRSIIRTGQLKSKSPVKDIVKKYAY